MLLLRLIARLLLLGVVGFTVALAAALAATPKPAAPPEPASRILGPVDDSARVPLPGSIPAAVEASQFAGVAVDPGADRGAVEDSMPVGRMLLLLRRSPAQEEALGDFIQAAHTPGDPSFHRWLKPGQFGSLYGPSSSDVAAVGAWLESHGLNVDRISAGRVAIEFSGTAGQMRQAFQIGIHRYLIEGEEHLASASNPTVPAALGPVIAGLAPMSDFQPRPQVKVLGPVQFNPKTHQAAPLWTYPAVGGVSYAVAPGDFATEYDIGPVYKAGITGNGQSIAIVSASNVDLSLVQAYRSLFGLAANLPQVVVDGQDPGQTGAAAEAYLDIELAGAIAPGARVVLYTSGGTALTNGLALAALRAVEDDLAGIVSVSYGQCELELGQSGNAFWSALWQQAAAQGQTVFVSAGDAGSAGCDNFEVQSAAYGGFQVNGIASTPYNVAVGGTDFYYSQNAASAAAVTTQLASYWTAATAAPAVSLKQPVPEQAWNDFFGYNLRDGGNPVNQPSQTILAGGGGMSNAALYPGGSPRGYPKPAWQAGSGVPADRLRDLPDVSLFAADGNNLSFYPICASPGDCSSANKTTSGAVTVTGAGGTSASAPAMAAIQALVDQSAGGWQGQANFVYYPLAVSQPTAFRDVKIGSNQVLCYPGTANCLAGAAKTRASGFSLEGGFGAFTGFDFATGLGSVDVANLIKYWGTVTRAPTVTTLSVSPSALAHGKTAIVTGTVAASGGGGTPTGSVSLTSNSGLTHYTGVGDFPLAAGSLSAQIDNLPGGTWQLTAVYPGDGNFAASKSAPVTVTVTPESNTLATGGWAWNPYDLYLYPLSAGMTLPYGAQIYLDAQPVSRNATIATQPTPATGTVSFTDKLGANSIASLQPLDAAGVAEWSTGVFAPGVHTVGATYSGDASYTSSTAGAAAFTVIPGSTSLTVRPLVTSVAAGAAVSVDVQMATGYLPLYGKLPTGSVTVTLGGKSLTAPLLAYGPIGSARMEAVVTFTGVAAGLLPLTATYPGDGNWLGSAANGGTVIVLASRMTPTVALVSSSSSPAPGQTFTLTATVGGPAGKPTPTGSVAFLADGQSFNSLANLTKGAASLSIPASSIANGMNVFTAVYQGDGNYTPSASKAVNVAVARPDFSLTTLTAEVLIARGKSAAGTLVMTPINGFSGTVAVTASAPAGIAATPATATPSVSAATTDLVNLTVSASAGPGVYPVAVSASGGGHIHTAQILVVVRAVNAPAFSPAPGTYATAQQVALTDATPGATIYYTIDGTTPTDASARYTAALQVSGSETIQAIALADGFAPSAVVTANYSVHARQLTAFGDSITMGNTDGTGITYPGQLQSLTGWRVSNQGVAGQTSTQIAVRMGAVPTSITAGIVIPVRGGVEVGFPAGREPAFKLISQGVLGTIAGITGYTLDNGSRVYTFFPAVYPANPVAVPAGTAWTPVLGDLLDDCVLIEAGRNNPAQPDQVLSDIAAMVAKVGQTADCYGVLTVLNCENPTEYAGAGDYKTIMSLNESILSTYGSHAIDIRSSLVASYNPGYPADVIDKQHDVPPTSLRARNPGGTLTSAISDASTCAFSTSWLLGPGTIITAGTEQILITGQSNSSYTCERGYASTTPSTHPSGTAYAAIDALHPGQNPNSASNPSCGNGESCIANVIYHWLQSTGNAKM